MDKPLLIRIARMYYDQNKTQQEIGSSLNLSRMAVSRLLQKARDEGIVQIKIQYEGAYTELEDEIKDKFGIREVVIMPADEGDGIKQLLSSAAANFLARSLKDGDIVGVGWGTTIAHIPEHMDKTLRLNATFVPLLGGFGQTKVELHANQVAANFAKKVGGKCHLLHAPAIVDTMELRNNLLADKSTKSVLDLARRADVAIIGIGSPLAPESSIMDSGYFTQTEIEELKMAGAECDICSCTYLDQNGRECQVDLHNRIIGISVDELRKIPLVIGVAGGEGKHLAIKLALQAGFIDVLVTDEKTGQYLLDK